MRIPQDRSLSVYCLWLSMRTQAIAADDRIFDLMTPGDKEANPVLFSLPFEKLREML